MPIFNLDERKTVSGWMEINAHSTQHHTYSALNDARKKTKLEEIEETRRYDTLHLHRVHSNSIAARRRASSRERVLRCVEFITLHQFHTYAPAGFTHWIRKTNKNAPQP